MLLRAREEKAFGLIELVIAMVMLNVGILALVATFQSGAVAIGRSATPPMPPRSRIRRWRSTGPSRTTRSA